MNAGRSRGAGGDAPWRALRMRQNLLRQYDGNDDKLYLPLARTEPRIVLTFAGSKIATVEPGAAFDAAEWEPVSQGIERSLLAGMPETGRDYSFSSLPVQGSWLGRRSGVQILPAPDDAPRTAFINSMPN